MKNVFWKRATSLLCLSLLLAAILTLAACTADPVYTYSLTEKTDVGVEIKETTLFMKVGDFAQIECVKVVVNVTGYDAFASVNTYSKDEPRFSITATDSGTCGLTIHYADETSSTLGLYILDAECTGCGEAFSNEFEYKTHTHECGHLCADSLPSDHDICPVCNILACDSEHSNLHNKVLACGHMRGEAIGDDHTTLADCGYHYLCTGKNHQPYLCGHYLCGGDTVEEHALGECGHYDCQDCEHKGLLPCGCPKGTEGEHWELGCGHCSMMAGDHELGNCEEHFMCEEGNHGEADCGCPACWIEEGDTTHTTLAECGEHFLCLGWEECSQFNDCGEHYLCVTLYEIQHTESWIMPCGNHYACQVGENEDHSFTYCLLHPACEIEAGDTTHSTAAECGHHSICSYSEEHPECEPCSLCDYCLADGTEHGSGICFVEASE